MTQPDRPMADHPGDTPVTFAERLTAPWWAWPTALGLGLLAAAEVHLGAPGLAGVVPYVVGVPVVLAGLFWLGRIRVSVVGDEFQVDDARLPVRFVGEVTVLDADAKRDVLGPYAEQYAFVVQRPWIPGAVQVRLVDPADPTPYWVVSTRHRQRLAAALTTARDRRVPPTA